MCTVTYISTGDDNFIFTSNRDEAPKRSAPGISTMEWGEKKIYFPKDSGANGSWIAMSSENQLVCILNGAFIKHKHLPPYRISRGIMALDFFSYESAADFFNQYNFFGIEPFTMIIFDRQQLYELRWDEKKKHIKEMAADENHIWASCTLYSEEWQSKRKSWFADWLEKYEMKKPEEVLRFHKTAGEGNSDYDIVMNRNNLVRTTSITSITKNDKGMNMRFEDLLTGKIQTEINR